MQHIFHDIPLLLIGVVIIIGFYAGGIARKIRLPSLIGFMLLGVAVGPSLLELFSDDPAHASHLSSFSFITEMALGFVAFSIGSELSMAGLKKLGHGIISIIFAESFCAFFAVGAMVYLFTRSVPAALLFGAIAPASAPAGTVAVIHELKAKGSLTQALYAVVGFDDGLAILIFGFAAAITRIVLMSTLGVAGFEDAGFLAAMKAPLLEILGSLVIGSILGFLFCQIVRFLKNSRDMLIITFGFVLIGCGLSAWLHLSLILTNMVIGFVLVNTRHQSLVRKVVSPLEEVMPLIFLLFFTLAGAHLNIADLPKLGVLGLVYILARAAGLIFGARLGGMLGHVEEKIKKWIGLGILSQAGVAIGLSLIIQHDYTIMLTQPGVQEAIDAFRLAHPDANPLSYDPAFLASSLITTVTATCIVFEIIGPILTKVALTKSGETNLKK